MPQSLQLFISLAYTVFLYKIFDIGVKLQWNLNQNTNIFFQKISSAVSSHVQAILSQSSFGLIKS